MHKSIVAAALIFSISLMGLFGCQTKTDPAPETTTAEPATDVAQPATPKATAIADAVPFVEAKNVVFSGPTSFTGTAPTLVPIELPRIHAAAAIWGATGRDHRGHIYFGISCDGAKDLSAHLVEYDPDTGRTTDVGGAVEQLKRLNLAKPGHEQNKIHSKIWQASDGYLYFTSMDEGGEAEDGSALPTFGSHLWRIRPGAPADQPWEHLAEFREAALATGIGGKWLYILGYYGHVLYQFDLEKKHISNMVRVGAIGGHTTRNFIVDERGYVYVPRVEKENCFLVEYDTDLRESVAIPLAGYSTTPDATSHGIVGVAPLKGNRFAFTTDQGRLYRLDPRTTGTALSDLGNFHPAGPTYAPCLFSLDGEQNLCGLATRPGPGEPTYEWVVHDLKTQTVGLTAVTVPLADANTKGLLIYGHTTRDNEGRCYLVGRYLKPGTPDLSIPAAWQLKP